LITGSSISGGRFPLLLSMASRTRESAVSISRSGSNSRLMRDIPSAELLLSSFNPSILSSSVSRGVVMDISTSVGFAPVIWVVTMITGILISGKFSRGIPLYKKLPESRMPMHITRTAMKCLIEKLVIITARILIFLVYRIRLF